MYNDIKQKEYLWFLYGEEPTDEYGFYNTTSELDDNYDIAPVRQQPIPDTPYKIISYETHTTHMMRKFKEMGI